MKFIYEIFVQSDNLSELRTRIENFEIGEYMSKYGLNAVFDNTFSSLPATKESELSFKVPKKDTFGFEIASDRKIISEIIGFLPKNTECIIRKTDTDTFAQKFYANTDNINLYPYATIKLRLLGKDVILGMNFVGVVLNESIKKTVLGRMLSFLLLADDSDVVCTKDNFPSYMRYSCRVGRDSAEIIKKEYKLLSLTDLEDLTREDPATGITVEINSVKKI